MATTCLGPVRGGADEYKILSDNRNDMSFIGQNDNIFTNGAFVSLVDGFLKIWEDGEEVFGVSRSDIQTASDNETVGQVEINVRRLVPGDTWKLSVILKEDTYKDAHSGGGLVPQILEEDGPLLTQADVGKFYDLDPATHFVDSASGTATKTTQFLQLVTVLGDGRWGEFLVV